MIEKPKKERRFLKLLGRVGEILIEQVLSKLGSSLIKKIGGKKTLPSILFLFLSLSLFAQYPATGNKQRLGYQTTGDGLVFRGRASDTVAIKSSGLNNAYFILDTVNNVLFNYIKTKGGWKFNNSDTVIINNNTDTTSLSNRINLKLNISDTASMLTNYLRSGVAASTYVSGSGTTNYLPKFTGSKILGNSLINDNGNYIGINKSTPTVGIDLVNDISAQSAKLRLQTNFASAQRTLELSSGDGLSWDIPNQTSQSPFIKVIGGDQSVGGGGLNLMTDNTSRLFIRKNGTIGIGTITPSATFEVHGSAVFNEGSTDSDFRVESDGNVNMVFVDASTDRVGIGTNAPTKTLEVSGTFNATGDITEGGLNVLTSADTTSLLIPYWRSGKFSGTLPIANGGTNANSASGSRNNLDVDYVYFATTAGAAVSLTSNRVFIVNTGSFSTTNLDLTPATSGRTFMIKNLASGTVISSASNVIPLNGGSASTDILSAGNVTPQWCTLVCDGTNWHIMQKN